MSLKPGLSMPLHWGDLLADTLHLTRGEFGGYMLLIGAYWSNGGPLPDQDTYLRNVARYEPGEWTTARPIFAAFFTVENGTWTHKRIEAELIKVRDTKERQRQRTAAATAARHPARPPQPAAPSTVPAAPPTPPAPPPARDLAPVTKPVTDWGMPEISCPPSRLRRKPADLNECLDMAQRIGLADLDARNWFRDCEAAEWRRGDGTLFDNWPKQMFIHRDWLRDKRARNPNVTGPAPASAAAEMILRQTELKRVEERMRVIKSSYEAHSTWDEKDRQDYAKLRDRKKELITLLGMTA